VQVEPLSSHEQARRRAFDPTYPTFLGVDDKLQRLLKWSYEILKIESPEDKSDIWDAVLEKNGIRKSGEPAIVDGFVTARNPIWGLLNPKDYEYLLVPEEIALKMKALECPLLKS
jgi:hypothetical protein